MNSSDISASNNGDGHDLGVQNSFSIYSVYANAGRSAPLILIFTIKFVFCTFCAVTNLDLALITFRNLRSLSSSCNFLIGCSGISNAMMALNSVFAFVVVVSGRNFIPVLHCTIGISPFFWAYSFSSSVNLMIGLDRLLCVLLPFWYLQKEKREGQKRVYLAILLLLCAIPSTAYLGLAFKLSLNAPDSPVTCTVGDPLMDKAILVIAIMEAQSVLTVGCYALIWAYMMWKKAHQDVVASDAQSRAIFKSLFLIVLLELVGWITNYSIRTILTPITAIFKIEPLDTWFIINVYAIVPYIAIGVSPVILCKYNKEYRNAFWAQWKGTTNVVSTGGNLAGSLKRGSIKQVNVKRGSGL